MKNADMMLHVEKNLVKNSKGEIVRLLGVNRAGLEWDANDDRIITSIQQACDDWKANIIRLPVSQDRWLGYGPEQKETDPDGKKYRELVDKIVDELYRREKYLILDLHWNNCGHWGQFIGQHYMPDMNSLEFWKDAAQRYKNHPAVLFGLYNEPHDVTWDVWKNGGTITERFNVKGEKFTQTYETPGLQKIADMIRELGAMNILVIGGLDWGYTLDGIAKGYAIEDKGGNGIIYDSHVYPWKHNWDAFVTVIKDQYPILIGECGHYGDAVKPREGAQSDIHSIWVPKLLNWIEENNYHLTAWDFHPSAGPCLIKNFDNEPTEFWGSYLKAFLAEKNK